jgi:glucose/arabinose dehydrogenase
MGAMVLVALPDPAAAGGAPIFESYITSGLSAPIGIVNADDGSGRLFVHQQGGALRVIRNDTLQTPPFLTLNASTSCRRSPSAAPETVGFASGGERGLLGVAFHPGYEANGYVFVSFSDVNGDSVVARFTNSTPASDTLVDSTPTSCVMFLRVDQDGANHNGGNILFGPDGFLYFALGDGGGGGATPGSFGSNDGCDRAQTLDPANLSSSNNCAADANFATGGGNANSRALLGKMLRINVDAPTAAGSTTLCSAWPDGSANYSIPAGNPFIGADVNNACDEVWAYGLRNPWRSSFDRETDDLFIGDVGQGAVEEIDFEPPATGGRNYGWRCFEGNSNTGLCTMLPVGTTAPIITYGHSAGRCSITGGHRYRGPVTAAVGQYFYGDYCTGEIWVSTFNGSNWSQPGTPFQDFGDNLLSFGEDEAGELYAVNGSQIWRLNGDRSENAFFLDGFEDP